MVAFRFIASVVITDYHWKRFVTCSYWSWCSNKVPNSLWESFEKEKTYQTVSNITKTIQFHGDGSEVRIPIDLPFQPPGLQWKGDSAITTRQLQTQRDEMHSQRQRHGTNTIDSLWAWYT